VLLDDADLLLIGRDHIFQRSRIVSVKMIRAGAAGEVRARPRFGLKERSRDQLFSAGPVEAHAALGRVHGLGDLEAEIPEMMAEGESTVPINRRAPPGIGLAERIGDNMGGRVNDPRKGLRLL
jgi:hypothetical protein